MSVSGYFQRTERLLKNLLPVQFPAPTPVAFFPIAVMRLDLATETEQNVSTPGFDLQATLVPSAKHLVTTGLTFYRDRSRDHRTTLTTTSMVGQVVLGQRGPTAMVFPTPVQLGPPVDERAGARAGCGAAGRRPLRAGRVAHAAARCRWSPAFAAISTR